MRSNARQFQGLEMKALFKITEFHSRNNPEESLFFTVFLLVSQAFSVSLNVRME